MKCSDFYETTPHMVHTVPAPYVNKVGLLVHTLTPESWSYQGRRYSVPPLPYRTRDGLMVRVVTAPTYYY